MSDSHLTNNLIALAIHALIAIIISCILIFVAEPGNSNFQPASVLPRIIAITCFLSYVICGFFFLKPVEKLSFLSVVSVAIILILVFIFFAITASGRSEAYAFSIYYINPIMPVSSWLFPSVLNGVSSVVAGILFFLSPLLPSLLLYLGMILRKLFKDTL